MYVSVGCGFLTSAVFTFVVDSATRSSTNLAAEQQKQQLLDDLRQLVIGRDGIGRINETLAHGLDRQARETTRLANEMAVSMSEILRSAFTSDIHNAVLGTGIVGAISMYSGLVPDQFLLSQRGLKISLEGRLFVLQ